MDAILRDGPKSAVAPVDRVQRLAIGWDATGPGRAALGWALAHGASVTIVGVVPDGCPPADWSAAAFALDEIVRRSGAENVDVRIDRRVVQGDVAWALADSLEPGETLVIGTHKTGFVSGRVRGSRSIQVAALVRQPLVVVPEVDLRFRTGVVVGVRDADEAAVLGMIAGREAAARRGEVLVLHAQPGPPDAATRAMLAVARDAATAAGVIARSRSVQRDPADALLDAARTSALLVMGAPMPGGRRSPIASTVHDVLLNANAPVLLLPRDEH